MPRRNLPPAFEDLRYYLNKPFLKSVPKRIEYLRVRLRRSPNWIDGHLRLAGEMATNILSSPTAPHARDFSALRLSCQAAMRLMGKEENTPPSEGSLLPRQQAEAELYLSLLAFAEKRFADSLFRMERVLEEKNASQISGSLNRLGLEYAATAAHALGENQKAEKFLKQIPSHLWTRDLKTLQQVLGASIQE